MKRAWAWLRSDTGRAAAVVFIPAALIAYAVSTETNGTPTAAGWIVGGIGIVIALVGWEYYL